MQQLVKLPLLALKLAERVVDLSHGGLLPHVVGLRSGAGVMAEMRKLPETAVRGSKQLF